MARRLARRPAQNEAHGCLAGPRRRLRTTEERASMSITRPEIDFPGGEPPAELRVTDIWEGDGSVARPGDLVKVHYVGVAYSTGEEFDASWNSGDPLQFRLGAGQVIAAGPGRAGNEGRRPPSADHPAGSGLRRPGRRARDRAGRDPYLRVRPGFDLKIVPQPEVFCPSRCGRPLFGRRTGHRVMHAAGDRSPGSGVAPGGHLGNQAGEHSRGAARSVYVYGPGPSPVVTVTTA